MFVAVHQPQSSTFLAVGVLVADQTLSGPSKYCSSAIYLSQLGLLFRKAATRSKSRVRHDFFESHAIEVREEDLKGFLSALQQIEI